MLQTLVQRISSFYTRKWEESASGIRTRPYRSYEDYVSHQATKLDAKAHRAEHYDAELVQWLSGRVSDLNLSSARVLCLGARLGGEVRVFRDLGAFAWGIDLNPGPANAYVSFGDFQDVRLADGCCDIIFTNSLDHASNPERVARETRRLLRGGGLLVVELADFSSEPPAAWESTYWVTQEAVVQLLEQCGFVQTESLDFAKPWKGTHVRLRAV